MLSHYAAFGAAAEIEPVTLKKRAVPRRPRKVALRCENAPKGRDPSLVVHRFLLSGYHRQHDGVHGR